MLARSSLEASQSPTPTTLNPTEIIDTSGSADSWQIIALEPDRFHEAFPHIQDLLEDAAAAYEGRHTLKTMVEMILAGEVQIWIAVDSDGAQGLVGSQISEEPTGLLTCQFRFVTGRGFRRWSAHAIEALEKYARLNGCSRIEAVARKGLVKAMPDYKISHVLLERKL